MKKILCIIPARSGSKSLPHKNIKSFRGKPLLAYSIEQAKKSKHDMRIIVSTDSNKYAKIAQKYGAETPFLRPAAISGDQSTDLECLQHALYWLETEESYQPDLILHLRPTQPLRKVADIDNTLDLFLKHYDEYDSLRSVVEFEKSPYKMYRINSHKNTLEPLFTKVEGIQEPFNQCRQRLPTTYLHNGYIDIVKADTICNGYVSGEHILPYLMNKEDTIDIDTWEDWKKAEITMS